MRSPILACLLSSVAINCLSQSQPDFSKVREIIVDRINNNKVPSVSIAVVKDGKILWEEGFGYADREKQLKATAHTSYCLASISKTITATAVMQLAEKKKLDLDSPANKYLGKGKLNSTLWDPRGATVRSLMNHTSGLTTYDYWCKDDLAVCAAREDEIISRYGVMVQPPGHFDYSNLGYGVLDKIVRNVSGKSYSDFLKQDLFPSIGYERFLCTGRSRQSQRSRLVRW
jgi:CubicO group peptidase (beta-lactamase class C family)